MKEISKKHAKRLARIARRKAAKARQRQNKLRVSNRGRVSMNGELYGYIEGSEAYNFARGI